MLLVMSRRKCERRLPPQYYQVGLGAEHHLAAEEYYFALACAKWEGQYVVLLKLKLTVHAIEGHTVHLIRGHNCPPILISGYPRQPLNRGFILHPWSSNCGFIIIFELDSRISLSAR